MELPIPRITPPRTTKRTFLRLAVSAAGSAATINKSACLPFSTVPKSFSRPMAVAPPRVAAVSTCAGVRPAACMASISA